MRPGLSMALMGMMGMLAAGCGAGDGPDVTVSGRVAPAASARRVGTAGVATARTVTHVIAVDPETASPRRSLAAVGADGSFELAVESGHPYIIVFIDSTAVGADMVVAMFRAGTLDSISPQLAGHLVLGEVAVDEEAQTATAGVSYAELLTSLGLSEGAAEYLGAVDDLSLRYANPDIDGDGVIDLEQDRHYALDVHVRADMRRGSVSGPSFVMDDITDKFLPDSGDDVATPLFNVTSIYALYPASYDDTVYVPQGAPGLGLQAGGAFSATLADGTPAAVNTSFSGLGFGDTRGWGPDYDFLRDANLELPGSGGQPATLAFTLGRIGKTLTFSNVVTRTKASLTATGELAIFLRLDTTDGAISAVDYVWKKRDASGAWVTATAEEIAVVISSEGGHVSFHRLPTWNNEVGIVIPAQPSGTVAWPHSTTRPGDICGLGVSYDDKLGLRHFVGGVQPNPGVSCTP